MFPPQDQSLILAEQFDQALVMMKSISINCASFGVTSALVLGVICFGLINKHYLSKFGRICTVLAAMVFYLKGFLRSFSMERTYRGVLCAMVIVRMHAIKQNVAKEPK